MLIVMTRAFEVEANAVEHMVGDIGMSTKY
jgi:hypothetical protein